MELPLKDSWMFPAIQPVHLVALAIPGRGDRPYRCQRMDGAYQREKTYRG